MPLHGHFPLQVGRYRLQMWEEPLPDLLTCVLHTNWFGSGDQPERHVISSGQFNLLPGAIGVLPQRPPRSHGDQQKTHGTQVSLIQA